MQDIDLFLKMLDNAEQKIDREYYPLDGVAISSDPPSVMSLPHAKSVVKVYQRTADGGRIHCARFEFNAQGQLEVVTIE
jgi:hypothetical protein